MAHQTFMMEYNDQQAYGRRNAYAGACLPRLRIVRASRPPHSHSIPPSRLPAS
jgi:hypothetical protein